MGKKSREKKERKGGPNPWAVPRRELVGLPPGKQIVAALTGRFSYSTTRTGNAIALLRSYQERFNACPFGYARINLNPSLSSEIRRASGTEGEGWARILARNATAEIGKWITTATPEALRELANFLEHRPIEPSRELRGALWPRPADPAAVYAALTDLKKEVEASGVQTAMPMSEVLDLTRPGHLDEKTIRAATIQVTGKKGVPGRPSNSES